MNCEVRIFYIAPARLTLVSLIDSCSVCIPLTALLYINTTLIIEVYLQCFTESVSQRELGKSTSRAEISSPSSLYFKAVKRQTHFGPTLLNRLNKSSAVTLLMKRKY